MDPFARGVTCTTVGPWHTYSPIIAVPPMKRAASFLRKEYPENAGSFFKKAQGQNTETVLHLSTYTDIFASSKDS